MGARLDTATRQKVEELAHYFHQPRATVLCHIMHWGVSRGKTPPLDQGQSQGPGCHLYFYVPSELHERVQQAATAAGVKTAPWIRHMVRQISMADFPASWQEATPRERSHDSRHYGKRFMLRLDHPTQEKLEAFSKHFNKSAAESIRQLIAHATIEEFPRAWRITGSPPRTHPRREASTRRRDP
jgi:predicted DNA-binding protein